MKPVCLRDPYVGGEGERLVCYRNRVLLARSRVQRVREHVVTVCSDFIGCMGGVPSSRVSEFRAAEVIEAQCTDGPLNDMGRCSNRHVIRGDRGVGWVERSLPGVGDRHVVVGPGSRGPTAAAHDTKHKQPRDRLNII